MSDYVRRLHLVVAMDVAVTLRQRLHDEFRGELIDSVRDQLAPAKLARASAPTVQVGWGLSGIFTQRQWDRLKDFRERNPDINGAKIAFLGSPDLYSDFWAYVAGLTPALVPLQEEGP